MRNSQKTLSTSIFRETNGQDQTTPERITVTSMLLSAWLKVKICSRNAKKDPLTEFLLVPTHIGLVPVP